MNDHGKEPGGERLPQALLGLFWDVNPRQVHLRRHRAFAVGRVLSRGTWAQISWLREHLGDGAIRDVLVETRARDLTRRQVRFWQVLPDLDENTVAAWLARPSRRLWEGRAT